VADEEDRSAALTHLQDLLLGALRLGEPSAAVGSSMTTSRCAQWKARAIATP
jgi:hypothetical protein